MAASHSFSPSLTPGPLTGLRVLELSTRFGYYCGKLLADMGAEVILIEAPVTGTPLRQEGPYILDQENIESGISYFYFNTNKRSITLDLNQPEGQALFKKLTADADLILEDGAPGDLDAKNLSFTTLQALNARLSITRITPFGQTGPFAQYAADDLTLLALGGWLQIMGYADTEPTQAACNQAYAMGSMFGAVGSMLALLETQQSGVGQVVDVSIQECVVMALENAAQAYELEHKIRARSGNNQRYAGSGIFPCADGHIYIFAGGMAAARFFKNLVQWLQTENVPGAEELGSPDWQNIDYMNSDAGKQAFARIFGDYARNKTMAFLYHAAQTRRIPLCPVNASDSIFKSEQLISRGFFVDAIHEASGLQIKMPGAPFHMSETPWQLRESAPVLGQHNREVYTALGLTDARLNELAAQGVI